MKNELNTTFILHNITLWTSQWTYIGFMWLTIKILRRQQYSILLNITWSVSGNTQKLCAFQFEIQLSCCQKLLSSAQTQSET